ncbi:MAG: tagaturonate epimerase family protein [Paludibaculum sp.]
MEKAVALAKYSFGMGDRFAQQGKAQLAACAKAAELGADIIPVWNKSNREHLIVGSKPPSVRAEADAAVAALGWTSPYHVDADHINLGTVDGFLTASDFFTLDVADAIGKPAEPSAVDDFVRRHGDFGGAFGLTTDKVRAAAGKYLFATEDAGRIYRHIESARGAGTFVTEVSCDETDSPQTPDELLVILAALADQKIPAQTIAPKFTGRFNKGVDYVGDPAQFEREFLDDIAVIAHAVKEFGLPANLKLSVHSGSDKFSIYPAIRRAMQSTGAGVHLKTAGTTWLEELIGLAEAGGEGLAMAKLVYAEAYAHSTELCAPYAAVIDIDESKLPSPESVNAWSALDYASALRHDQSNPAFNANLRQLLHVGYKVAAKLGDRYLQMVRDCEESVARNVTENLFDRHIARVFL